MKPPCDHAKEVTGNYVVCDLGEADGKPSHGTCRGCLKNTSRGWPESKRRSRYVSVTAPPIKPIPREQWPIWAKWIAENSEEADKGVGDTVKRMLGVGGETFKAAMKARGKPCGCDARQVEWNTKYPYHFPREK